MMGKAVMKGAFMDSTDFSTGETRSVQDHSRETRALPLEKNPMLREVVLVVGDGLSTVEVLRQITELTLRLEIPFIALRLGMAPLSMVWKAGREMSPPLFFDGEDGLHHVDPGLLAAVRAQELKTCPCGAHHEVDVNCYLCVRRMEWSLIAGLAPFQIVSG